MKIATILPLRRMGFERDNDYHMALAHLLYNEEYRQFFIDKSARGDHVIMDNGVVETGIPMRIEELISLAKTIRATELICPDFLGNRWETVKWSSHGVYQADISGLRSMVVPQGRDQDDWVKCMEEMLTWIPRISAIGVSKFITSYMPRAKAVELIDAQDHFIPIHLLGCPGDPREIADISSQFPGRVRGVDSGVAAFYSAGGVRMASGKPRPDSSFDFLDGSEIDPHLIQENREYWRMMCLPQVVFDGKEDDDQEENSGSIGHWWRKNL